MPDTIIPRLERLGACKEARDWVRDLALDDPRAAYDACRRGDWLLWLAAKLEVDRKLLVRAACACARAALQYVSEGCDAPLRALEVTEAWTRGEATLEEVRTASNAIYYASNAASNAAYYASNAAYCDSNASASAASSAYCAASYAASRDMADLVRAEIPFEVIEPLLPA